MRNKCITAMCLALLLACASPCGAAEDFGPLTTVADLVIVRPGCLAATVVGSAFFVLSLPFAATSKSIKKTANLLVVQPAKATFTRPLGDMEALQEY